MSTTYSELHCHSNYSFQEGASSVGELLLRAKSLEYPALALTDHDNLCGAMEFARAANSIGVHPIIGAEVTLTDGSHLTLLAETAAGYGNLCQLITRSRIGGDRRDPRLDPKHFPAHAEGLILLTGCRKGCLPDLMAEGRWQEGEAQLRDYLDWFGSVNVFIELQQNLAHGDTRRNKRLLQLARRLGVAVVATNNVHYHLPERHKLQDLLVAINHNKTLEETHRERRPNAHFYLKTAAEMASLFDGLPEAVRNSTYVAERCAFDLTRNLGYEFPAYPVPEGYNPQSYLVKLCHDAAVRRYGSITPKVQERLTEEFRLIQKHNLAGFFLIYYEIIQLAHEVMVSLGLTEREISIEERPPGRGRGSSVALLVGYLIGLSHIDPLQFDLSLDRFLNDEMGSVPDIDLDFPRDIREELIKRVHEKWGWDYAVLSGMIATYKMQGAVRDAGKALGLPAEDVDKLAKRVDVRHADSLESEMLLLPDFQHKVGAPVWRDLIELAPQLEGFPKYLAQHPGGMIISSSSLTNVVPVQQSAIEDRYICHWDKDSIHDAGFVKIDFLALGALSQMQEALGLIEERSGRYIDLSRIDFQDQEVYGSIHRADTVGIFQVESAAQMQTVTRIKPTSLAEMAYEVAAVRPGVGINDGVTQFIERYVHGAPWSFDHPLEERALARTKGIILFQDQVNQLAVDVAGLSPKEADDLRRAFGRKNNRALLETYWEKFRDGAAERSVPEDVSLKVFKKFSGQYMFPESHAYAFGITAYQMAWLKHYYPLEFFVAIFNQQPMGFYNLETLKEDAKRHGVKVLNPDVNRSRAKCVIKDESLLLGLLNVKGIGQAGADAVVQAREHGEPFHSLADAMQRTGLQQEALDNLAAAGAFDAFFSDTRTADPGAADRRAAVWEVGLRYRPVGVQQALPLPVDQDSAELPPLTPWENMMEEYRVMGLHPGGHFMSHLRPLMDSRVLSSDQLSGMADGEEVSVAGLVIRRQHPNANAVFITLEDEHGHTPLVVWPQVFKRYRLAIKEPVLKVRGFISRRDGSMNVVATAIEGIKTVYDLPPSKNWG